MDTDTHMDGGGWGKGSGGGVGGGIGGRGLGEGLGEGGWGRGWGRVGSKEETRQVRPRNSLHQTDAQHTFKIVSI